MNKLKILNLIAKLGVKKLVIGGITATLALGGVGGVIYYNNVTQENKAAYTAKITEEQAKKAEEIKIEETSKEDAPPQSEVKEEPKVEPVAEEAKVEPKEEKKTEQTTETKKQGNSGSTSGSKGSTSSGSTTQKPSTPPPTTTEPSKPTPPPEKPAEPKPSIPVGFNQEVTNKINAVNSYGGNAPGINRQAYITACIAIAKGQGFDKASLSTYYEGQEKFKYITHNDNVVTRSEPMTYYNDYKNIDGANNGFKYTVAFWTGSTWKFHCINIRNA